LKECTKNGKEVFAVATDNGQNVRNAVINCCLYQQFLVLDTSIQDGLDAPEVHTVLAQAKKLLHISKGEG